MVYYENILAQQNYLAKPNLAWAADFTSFELSNGRKIYVFICIDVFSNKIIVPLFRTKQFTSYDIIQKLNKAIETRLPIKPRRELILHTDRGSQFTSETYNQFVKQQEGFILPSIFILPSMSRANKPKDNAVVERFIRTLKEHKINDRTLQEEFFHQIEINSKFKGYRKVFNLYVRSLNLKPNKKSFPKSPEQHDLDTSMASMLMVEPIYYKAFSKQFGSDFRRYHIDHFKNESKAVTSILDEIATKRSEIVDKTPFDTYDDNLVLKVIDDRLNAIYGLIQSNPEVTREYVEEAILPIQDMLESMDEKINLLLPKKKKERVILSLRDPVNTELFNLFRAAAGSQSKYKQDLKSAQLTVAYTILFYTGLRVNEIRIFQEKDIQDAIKTSQFSVVHFKQKEPHIHVISDRAVQELKKLKYYLEIIFVKYKYTFLFGKNQPVHEKYLIQMINKDLKHTCQINQIPYNIKSHSFRIHVISSLLKITSVQNAVDIIGHNDIRSTLKYSRYSMSKKQIQELMHTIANSRPERLNQIEEGNLT